MNHNLKTLALGTVLCTTLLSMASCGDELPDPIVLPRTLVDIHTDWSGIDAQQRPQQYVLSVNGDNYNVASDTYQMELKSNRDYTFLAYVPVLGVDVNDGIATVEAASQSTGIADAISGTPSTFYCAAQTVTSLTGDKTSLTLPMQQTTRQLNVSLKAKVTSTDGSPVVQGGYAILSKAMATYNMYTSIASTAVDAVSDFSINATTGTITAPFNVFALDLSKDVTVQFVMFLSDGTQQRLETSIGNLVANFNDGSHSTIDIGGKVSVDGSNASVTNWTIVDMGVITATERQ